jgi:hypothetical protein
MEALYFRYIEHLEPIDQAVGRISEVFEIRWIIRVAVSRAIGPHASLWINATVNETTESQQFTISDVDAPTFAGLQKIVCLVRIPFFYSVFRNGAGFNLGAGRLG